MWYGIFKISYAVWTGTAWRYTYAVTAKADKEEYQSEVLSCVAGGVYAKSFSLFYGESIQYYFLEDDGKKKKKTQDASLLCNNVTPKEPQGRFDYLNDMLVSMEMHDMATMKKLMQGYCVQDYVVEQMFQPF